MYRFLLTPRWGALTLLVLLAVPFCVFMGLWQLGRFEDRVDAGEDAKSRPHQAPVAITDLLGDGSRRGFAVDDVNRPVRAAGSWDRDARLTVPGRLMGDRDGYWVVDLLRPEGGGRAVPVVRGWASEGARTAERPEPGEVEVTGYLRAPESEETDGAHPGTGLPDGQIGMVSGAILVNQVDYPVYDAWVADRDAPAGLTAIPPESAEGIGLTARAFQNLGYTGEWFVFAGFAVFMWYRFVRREAEVRRDREMGLTV